MSWVGNIGKRAKKWGTDFMKSDATRTKENWINQKRAKFANKVKNEMDSITKAGGTLTAEQQNRLHVAQSFKAPKPLPTGYRINKTNLAVGGLIGYSMIPSGNPDDYDRTDKY